MSALCNRRTKAGALESTNQAIELAATAESADYIRYNWLPEIEKWAHFARDHSALLLQVTTTNPIEAWHRALKSLSKLTKLTNPRYSLAGIIALIDQCAESYWARAQKAEYDWSKKKLSATLEYPWLHEFPYQIQLLLLDQIKAAASLAELGKDVQLSEDNSCACQFARSYWLPCSHVILAYEFYRSIEEPNWSEFARLFDESGFEIYSTRALIGVEKDESAISREIEAKLHTSETLDQIRSRFFELSEVAGQLDAEEKERLFNVWESELARNAEALIGRSVDDWISRAEGVIFF